MKKHVSDNTPGLCERSKWIRVKPEDIHNTLTHGLAKNAHHKKDHYIDRNDGANNRGHLHKPPFQRIPE
jgi:hypothetical protein